jgi:hypothetical protein
MSSNLFTSTEPLLSQNDKYVREEDDEPGKGVMDDLSRGKGIDYETGKSVMEHDFDRGDEVDDSSIYSKTIFLLSMADGALSLDAEEKPYLIKCNIKNLKKKNIAKPGCRVHVDLAKEHNLKGTCSYDECTSLLRDFLEKSEGAPDIKEAINSLSQEEKDELITRVSKQNYQFNPKLLLQIIIDDYISKDGNLACSYPTISQINEAYKRFRDPLLWLSAIEQYKDVSKITSCEPLENIEYYWETQYFPSDSPASMLISFTIGSEIKYYDIFSTVDLEQLSYDLHGPNPLLAEKILSFIEEMKEQELADGSMNFDPSNNIFRIMETPDIFKLLKYIQDNLNKEDVVFIDYSCKIISELEYDPDASQIYAEEQKTLSEGELQKPIGFGGYRRNKSKKINQKKTKKSKNKLKNKSKNKSTNKSKNKSTNKSKNKSTNKSKNKSTNKSKNKSKRYNK